MSEGKESAGLTLGRDATFELRILKALSPERLQQLLGQRYAVIRELGAGGTSIVFLAEDRERGHPVAVKVLRPELSVAVVAARFLREIELGQRLDHPNVLPIYESGSADGELFCTMPFVDGETLRQRLARERNLSIADTLRIARAVANALDYAHGLGVIHRDIKPANILLDGDRVIVADFGMARAMTAAASGDLTETGLAIGTAAYMSPEQGNAERVLDGRTDVYSLACVVYEMLAGEPPFTGPTQQAIIARHSQEAPRSLRIVRPSVPVGVQRAVERALAKVPADRFATAGAFLGAIEAEAPEQMIDVPTDSFAPADERADSPERAGSPVTVGVTPGTRWRALSAAPWIAAAIASVTALVAGVGWWRATHEPPPAPIRFTVEPPAHQWIRDRAGGRAIALSRDGQMIAFAGGATGQLFVYRLGRLGLVPLRNARGRDLHFSPDGKWLVYTSGGPTRISIDSGPVGAEPVRLSRLLRPSNLAWTYSSDVLYIADDTLWRVPAAGGAPTRIASMDTTLDTRWGAPSMLPDGNTIAFRVTPRGKPGGSAETDRLALIPIGGGTRTLLDLESQGAIGYVDGTLIFSGAGGRIMAVEFDVARRRPLGEPIAMVDNVAVDGDARAMAAVSDNGTLAYLVTKPSATMQIVDERGTVVRAVPGTRPYLLTRWSPDGKRIAMYEVAATGTPDLWIYDLESGARMQLTTTGATWPAWSADGQRIGFTGWRGRMTMGGPALWAPADGSRPPEPIPGTSVFSPWVRNVAFSGDGKYVIVRVEPHTDDATAKAYAFAVPLAGGPHVRLDDPNPHFPEVSPDGKWLAYHSAEGPRPVVYVRPFPPRGSGRTQVSPDEGYQPRWSGDGRKLYYRAGTAFRVATLDVSGALPRVTRIDTLTFGLTSADRPIASYDVHPGGKLFVVTRDLSQVSVVVVLNWMTEVRAALAAK